MPSVNEFGEWVLRVLAVAGGAAVGGFGTGFLMQLVARLTVTRPLPRPAVNVLRILGAIVLGCIVGIWVFKSGGGGFGFGGGGFGFGLGGTGETGASGTGKGTESGRETRRTDGEDPTTGVGVLRVEVLGDRPEERKRFYRIEGTPARLTIDEVQARLLDRKKESPSLERLVIVLYLDSPDKDKMQVRDLQELAKDMRLRPLVDSMDRKAP